MPGIGTTVDCESLFRSSRFFHKILYLMDAIRWNGMYIDNILEHVVDQLSEYRSFPTWEEIVRDVYYGDEQLAHNELTNSSDATQQLFDVNPWKQRDAQAAAAREKSRSEEETDDEEEMDEE